ncbi:MAG: helix-turn-helix domain-containing protein [Nitrospirales bacterium]|nr:helix-turn-helix domain-containing protein [Nitrospirales bacterium]
MNRQTYNKGMSSGVGDDAVKEATGSERIEPFIQEFRCYSARWLQRVMDVLEKGEATHLTYKMFCELFDELSQMNGSADDFQPRLHLFISAHLDQRVTLQDIAEFLVYSEKYAAELFKRRMGEPFSCYLKRLRLEKAKSLLMGGERSLAHIAEALGFQNAFAFSHFFKKAMGHSPAQFRRNIQSPSQLT